MNTSPGTPSLRGYRPRHFPDRVRIGRNLDGGYVLPLRMVTASQALLSLGVDADWSFEEALLAASPALEITCVDGTTDADMIRARVLRELGRALLPLRFAKALRFARLLGKPRAFRKFFARQQFLKLMVAAQPVPGLTTLAELLARVRGVDADRWVLVKMDIERSEYPLLAALRDVWARVAGLVIEVHELDRHGRELETEIAARSRHFYIAHVHANNHDGHVPGTSVPITLVNKALCPSEPPLTADTYPILGLDWPCKAGRPDLALSFE